MINSESMPLMTQTVANSGNLYNFDRNKNLNSIPNTTKLILEQQYNEYTNSSLNQNQYSNQFQNSDPYTDFQNLINSCSDITKEKIFRDQSFQQMYATCEEVLKRVLYRKVIPEVLADSNGRVLFEQLYALTKTLKDELIKKDMQKEKTFDLLMQDEVVLRRLQELQNSTHQTNSEEIQQTIPQFPTPQQNTQRNTVEPISSAQNNSQNQNNQQNQYQNQNTNKKNNNKPQNYGGATE